MRIWRAVVVAAGGVAAVVVGLLAGAGAREILLAQAPAGAYGARDFRTLEGVLLERLDQLNAGVAALADAVRNDPPPASASWAPPEPASVRLLSAYAGGHAGHELYSLRVEVEPPAAAAFVQCAWEHGGGTTLSHGPLSATVQLTPSPGDSVAVYCYSRRGEELVDTWRAR